jgi:ankyrin repeat protein
MSHIQRVLYGNLGNSAIHVAVEQKDGPRVKLLLDQDATRLNSFNKSEQAPLHLAFLTNDQDMVKLLLEYYACVFS